MTGLVEAVARHGLPGAGPVWPEEPLDDAAWRSLAQQVAGQKLTGLLSAAVAGGVLPVTEEQRQAVHEAEFASSCASLLLESATLSTFRLLVEADVRVRVLKGPAVAHLDYLQPAQRLFSDVDVLVHPDDFDRGVGVLSGAGNVRRFPEPRPGFDRRFSKGTSFDTPDGLEIDYHRTFVMGPFGLRLAVEDLWSGSRSFALAGQDLEALDDDIRFLHACFHAALGNVVPRLVPLRDVAQMLCNGRLALDRVRRLMRAWGAEAVVASAVSTSAARLALPDDTSPLVPWARAYQPDQRERAALAVYSDPEGSYAGKSLAALRALPRLQDKIAYAYALTFPQRSYVEGRHEGAQARWRRGTAAARRLWTRA